MKQLVASLSSIQEKITKDSEEVLSCGPVSIWQIGESTEPASGALDIYQAKRGWVPLLLATRVVFTKVAFTGSTPLLLHSNAVEVHAHGRECRVIATGRVKLRGKSQPKEEPPVAGESLPDRLFTLFSPPASAVKEHLALMMSDKTTVYCPALTRVIIYHEDTVVVHS